MHRIRRRLISSMEPPMPYRRRGFKWGDMIRNSIKSNGEPLRVAIIATGGLSHSIGEPTMGTILEDFDRETIRLFNRPHDELVHFLEAKLPASGNGSEEVRNWLVAHGAADGDGFELVDYLPVPKVIVGCGFAAWRV